MNEEPSEEPAGRAKGGKARAEKLSPERRSEIASKAAATRWAEPGSEAVCGSPDQPLQIGEVEIECYVLDDGTRALTQKSFLTALGRHGRPMGRRGDAGDGVPAIFRGKAISPFVTDDIIAKSQPISFRLPTGGRASGYNAELLPEVCEVYLKARDADVLPANQRHIAQQAEILMRGLAHVGIIALVDEATGYQELRKRDALARILEAYIDEELHKWMKTFPDDFYQELFRLRGFDYPRDTVRRPRYFGHLTNDIVYDRLAPGVLEELKRANPKDGKGKRKNRHFQWLTSNVGYPKLREHLGSVVTIMKLSDEWDDFMSKLNRLHPRVGDTIELPFDDPPAIGL